MLLGLKVMCLYCAALLLFETSVRGALLLSIFPRGLQVFELGVDYAYAFALQLADLGVNPCRVVILLLLQLLVKDNAELANSYSGCLMKLLMTLTGVRPLRHCQDLCCLPPSTSTCRVLHLASLLGVRTDPVRCRPEAGCACGSAQYSKSRHI